MEDSADLAAPVKEQLEEDTRVQHNALDELHARLSVKVAQLHVDECLHLEQYLEVVQADAEEERVHERLVAE